MVPAVVSMYVFFLYLQIKKIKQKNQPVVPNHIFYEMLLDKRSKGAGDYPLSLGVFEVDTHANQLCSWWCMQITNIKGYLLQE